MEKEYRQYIIFPPMLTMNPGKLAAQAAHAANKMRKEILEERDPESDVHRYLHEWEADYGAGTTIVLQADWAQILMLQSVLPHQVHPDHYIFGFWRDPSYPLQYCGEVKTVAMDVCVYLFSEKSLIEDLVKDFRLHP